MRKFISVCLCLLTIVTVAETSPVGWRGEALERARGLCREGRYTQALRELEHARNEYALSAVHRSEIEWLQTLCTARAGGADAEAVLKNYLEAHPHSVYAPQIYYELARLAYAEGDYARTRDLCTTIPPKRLPRERRDEYHFIVGHSLFELEEYEAARRELDATSGEYARHADYMRGYMAYREGDRDAARNGFRALENDPAYGTLVPYYLLQIEYAEGDWDYVTAQTPALLERTSGPRRAELLRMLAGARFHRNEWTAVRETLARLADEGVVPGRQERYMSGYAAYMLKDWQAAADDLPGACGADDSLSQNASYHLADCYLRLGDKQGALASLAIAAAPGFDPAIEEDALYNYGKLQYELGGGVFNEAIHVLTRYLERYPDSPRAAQVREYLAAAYYNSRDYAAAWEAISRIPDPDNDLRGARQKIAYFRALDLYRAGDLQGSRQLLETSLRYRFNPGTTALTGFWLGELDCHDGKWEQAAERFAAYLRVAPRTEIEYAWALYDLGYCYFQLDRRAEARTRFTQFLDRYPTGDRYRADALNRMGDLAAADRHFWQAIEWYDKAAALGTAERHYSAWQRALMLGYVDRPERKIESLEALVNRAEGDYVDEAFYELGRTYVSEGRYAEGAATFRRFIDERPASPRRIEALAELGLALQNLDRPDEALKCYRQAIAEAPRSQTAREALASVRGIYVDRGDVEGYFDYARRSGIETDLGTLARDSLTFAAAEKVYLSGRSDEAAEALQRYVQQWPEGQRTPDALWLLSGCRLAQGDPSQAAEALRRLVALPSGDYTVRGLKRLAELEERLDRPAEAAEVYRRLAAATSSSAEVTEALRGLVRCTVAAGDAGQTVAVCDEVLTRSGLPDDLLRETRYAKASALETLDRPDEAAPLWATLAAEAQSAEGAEAVYRTAAREYASGDDGAAERRIIALGETGTPQTYWLGKAYLLLGDIYAARGDAFQARATWQSIVDGYSPADDGIVETARNRIATLQ